MNPLNQLERRLLARVLEDTVGADCAILVGSVARGTRNSPVGDVDILIINGSPSGAIRPGIQTMRMSLDDLRDRVFSGDDFTQWALRFGIPLSGRRNWESLRGQLLAHAPWPDSNLKRTHARRRLEVARQLLDIEDLEATKGELVYAAGHLARAFLLDAGVFPLSRPELPIQLREKSNTELAELLERVREETPLTHNEAQAIFDQLEACAA